LPDVARGEGDLRDTAFGLPASGNGAREFSVVRDDQDAGVIQETTPKNLVASGLQFFGFLYEGEEALGTDAKIDRGFGVFGALGLFDAALEVRYFGFR